MKNGGNVIKFSHTQIIFFISFLIYLLFVQNRHLTGLFLWLLVKKQRKYLNQKFSNRLTAKREIRKGANTPSNSEKTPRVSNMSKRRRRKRPFKVCRDKQLKWWHHQPQSLIKTNKHAAGRPACRQSETLLDGGVNISCSTGAWNHILLWITFYLAHPF